MPKTRRKAEKLPAAQTEAEAIVLLTRYAALASAIAARNERVAAAIASLRAQADALNAPEDAEQKAIFLQLKPWWAVAGEAITGGLRKSWELGGCLIGHRTGNPTLLHPKPEAVAVELLYAQGWHGCLRVKFELDKPMLTRGLAGSPFDGEAGQAVAAQLKSWGFSIVQKEEFFIDRLPPRGPGTETVADPQALQVAA